MRERVISGGLLALLLLGFFHESLLGGRVLLYTDNVRALAPWSAFQPGGFTPRNRDLSDPSLAYYPLLDYARERILDGELPLWNPYLYAGTPLLGNLTAAPFYPMHAVLWMLGMKRGLAWHAALRLFLAGGFVWALARHLGAGPRGALLAGLVYPLTGYPILWVNHALGWVAVCGPPLFYFTERLLRSPSRGAAVGLALTVTTALLGGHPETALYLFAGAGLYAGLRALSPPAARVRRFGVFVLAAAAGAALAAPVLLPCLEYLTRSSALQLRGAGSTRLGFPLPAMESPATWLRLLLLLVVAGGWVALLRSMFAARKHAPRGWHIVLAGIATAVGVDLALGLGLSRRGLLLLDPNLYGGWRPGARPYHGFETYLSVNAGYAGVLALLVAVAGLVLRPGGAAGALGVVLLVAFAKVARLAPIYTVVKALPPFDLSADTRALAVVVLAVSVLAGLGWGALEKIAGDVAAGGWRRGEARGRLRALAAVAAAAALAGGLLAARAWLRESPLPWEVPVAAAFEPARGTGGVGGVAAHGGAEDAGGAPDAWGGIESPGEGQRIEGDTVTLAGRVPPGVPRVHIFLGGTPLATVATTALPGGGRRFTWTWACPAVEEGIYRLDVLAEDAAGEIAAQETRGVEESSTAQDSLTAQESSAARGTPALRPIGRRAVRIVRPISLSGHGIVFGALALAMLAAAALAAWHGRLGGKLGGVVFAAAAAVAVGDLVAFGRGWTPPADPANVYPETPAIRFLREHAGEGRIFAEREAFRPNSALVFRLRDVKGYDALDPADYIVYLRSLLAPAAPFYDIGWEDLRMDSPWLDLLGVRWIVTKKPMPEREGLRRVYDGEVEIYENLRAMPLVTAVFRSRAFGTLGGRHPFDVMDPREEVLLREPSSHAGVEGKVREVHLLAHEPERILVRARLDRDGFLVIAENDFPGWQARLRPLDEGGRPAGEWQEAEILNADYTFRAIPVPAGDLEVECRYRPASLRLGLGVALAGLVVLVTAAAAAGRVSGLPFLTSPRYPAWEACGRSS